MTSIWNTGQCPPVPARFNLAAHVLAHAGELAGKPALEIVGHRSGVWSYARLLRAVLGVAAGLRAQGLTPGDRVLLRLGNDVDFPLAFLGAIAAGLVPVPTSAQLTRAEITPMAAIVSPSLIIAADGIALPRPRPCPVLTAAALHAFTDLPGTGFDFGAPDRPAYVIFTSGTGGQPRAVVHAHRAIWARRMMYDGWYGLRKSDRMLHAGALNWTYTLGTGLMDPWSVGATALIASPGTPSADLGAQIAAHDVTLFAAVPGIFRQMLHHGLPPLPALRHGLSAGEKLSETIRTAWKTATGTDLHEAFGMSECSTFISGSPTRPAPPGTLGYPQPGRHIAILGDDGKPVAIGQRGTIAIRTDDPGLMLGYDGAAAATSARFRDGWFLTGDIATMGADGAITYLGRHDDMMNAGGYRVSPAEVEAIMAAHAGVHEAAAVELKVKSNATIIALFYVPETHPVADDILSAHAHAHLAPYKCPRRFIAVDTLPRGPNNKVLRRVLRHDWETAHADL